MSRKGLLGCFVTLALLAAMATGASAQAAGTRICPDNLGTTCAGPYAVSSVFKGTGFFSLSGLITCSGTSSSIELEITAMGGGDETTEIFALTGTGCTGPTLGTCSVRALNLPWTAPVHVLGTGPNGTAKATAASSPGFKIFACSSGLTCEYVAPPATGPAIEESITGGKKATFKASGPTMEWSGGSTTGCSALSGLAMVHEVGGSGGFYVRT